MVVNKNRNKMILETLMGDPILSFYVNSGGVAIGTALGRVSSYIFTEPTPYTDANLRITDSSVDNTYLDKDSTTDRSNKDSKDKRTFVKDVHEADVPNEMNAVSDYHVDLESNPVSSRSNNTTDRSDKDRDLKGRYYVFASYSDEPVNALYIHDKYLASLVGLNTIIVYNIEKYSIEKQMNVNFMLNLGGNNMYNKYSNYKQVVQSNEHVLVLCNKYVVLLNLLKAIENNTGSNASSSSNRDTTTDGSNKDNKGTSSDDLKNDNKDKDNESNNEDNSSNNDNDSSKENDENNKLNRSLSLREKLEQMNLRFSKSMIQTRLNVSSNLLNSNVLYFEYPNIITVYYSSGDDDNDKDTSSNSKKTINLYEIVGNSAGLVNGIEIADKKYNLVNQCKLWDSSVVVVLDYVNVLLYSNEYSNTTDRSNNMSDNNNNSNENNNLNRSSNNNGNNRDNSNTRNTASSNRDNGDEEDGQTRTSMRRSSSTDSTDSTNSISNRVSGYRANENGLFQLESSRKMKEDVLGVDCSLKNFMVLLNKKSKIEVLNRKLDTVYTYNLYGSTFELGWSYSVLVHKDYLVYNSDEGVFMFRVPHHLD